MTAHEIADRLAKALDVALNRHTGFQQTLEQRAEAQNALRAYRAWRRGDGDLVKAAESTYRWLEETSFVHSCGDDPRYCEACTVMRKLEKALAKTEKTDD